MLRHSSDPRTRKPQPTIVLLALLACSARAASAAPDPERLQKHVVQLAGTIGPRKTGSDADGRAIRYVQGEMEAAGLSVTLQRVETILERDGEKSVGSANVIGSLRGDSAETILIAAHHDSRSAIVPGANDDASGVAVLLEAARAVAARPRRLSYLFVSFCGEEEGLLGSKAFLDHAPLEPLRAVIALELVGRGELLVGPVPRPPETWAQDAFLRAARNSRVRGAVARPIWTLVPRFLDLPFSADHEPFLDRGVPALLLLGTYPAWTYHTAEDSILRVRKESLARAATLLDALLRDLEERAPGPPSRDTHFLPLVILGQGVVIPGATLRTIALLSLAAILAAWLARVRVVASFKGLGLMLRVVIVTLACTAIGVSGLVAGLALMQTVHHVRHPWVAHHGLHLAHAVALALVTGWIALKLFRRIKPTVEPGPYLAAALLLPALLVIAGLASGSPELAALAAVSCLAFLSSLMVESIGRKLALGLLGLVPLLMFMTPEDYRTALDLAGLDLSTGLLFAVGVAIVFPFALFVAHVASFQDCLHSPFWWWISGPVVGGVAVVVWLALAATAAWLPAYDGRHPQIVRMRQSVDLATRQARLMVHSNDSLRGVTLRGLGGRLLSGDEDTERIDLAFPGTRIAFEAAATLVPEGETMAVTCRTRLTAPQETDRLSYVLTSRSGFRLPERDGLLRHAYTFTETAPRLDPERTFRLRLPPGGDLRIALRAEFALDLLGIDPEGPARLFVTQASVTDSRQVLGASPAGPN